MVEDFIQFSLSAKAELSLGSAIPFGHQNIRAFLMGGKRKGHLEKVTLLKK